MTRPQYWLVFLCSFVAFVLAAVLLGLHFQNQRVENNFTAQQTKLAGLQEQMQRGEISRRMVQTIAQDLFTLVGQKPEVQSLLARYGITLKKTGNDDK